MRTNKLTLLNNAFSLVLRVSGLTANREIIFPSAAPTANQSLRANSTNPNQLEWFDTSAGGGLTSVGFTTSNTDVFSVTNSPLTINGNLNLALNSQTQNFVLSAPSGANGTPTFRLLTNTDIPNLSAGKITTGTFAIARLPVGTSTGTVAAGDDSRFHTQNTDTGTTNTSFQLNLSSSGVRLKDVSGTLQLRNSADNDFADLVIRNLTVSGTQTIINTEEIQLADNVIVLNSNYTGSTPTENVGLEVERGTITSASLIWDESADFWRSGLLGSERRIVNSQSFSYITGDIVSNTLTINHNFNTLDVRAHIRLANGNLVYPPTTVVNANSISFDMEGFSVAGTVVVMG